MNFRSNKEVEVWINTGSNYHLYQVITGAIPSDFSSLSNSGNLLAFVLGTSAVKIS